MTSSTNKTLDQIEEGLHERLNMNSVKKSKILMKKLSSLIPILIIIIGIIYQLIAFSVIKIQHFKNIEDYFHYL